MGLRDIESRLPPGFRFHPSDEELVCHYLYRKVSGQQRMSGGESVGATMVEVDLHTVEPWELPEMAKLSAEEWYFFSFRDRKYATGSRTNRATRTGYWKATGKDRAVVDPLSAGRRVVGMRKTLVFYSGRAPNGVKSQWVMHEFRLESPHIPPKEDWVLCRVFNKGKAEESRGVDGNEQDDYNMGYCAMQTVDQLSYSPPPLIDYGQQHHQHHNLIQDCYGYNDHLHPSGISPSGFPQQQDAPECYSSYGSMYQCAARVDMDHDFLSMDNCGAGSFMMDLGEVVGVDTSAMDDRGVFF